MGIMRKYLNNTRKPVGSLGKMMVSGMNKGHAKVSDWGMTNLPELKPSLVADLGCGGGRNVGELLKRYPKAKVMGVDYSDISVAKSKKENEKEIQSGRCRIMQGDVSDLLLGSDKYDLATAFETIYFWPGPVKSFKEVYRILHNGGYFMITNETDGYNDKDRKWEEMIDHMKIYSEDEICDHLKEAGFKEVQIFRKKENNWICFVAKKIS